MDEVIQKQVRGYWAKAQQRLEVARGLREQGHIEEAVSLAYYAAFWAAKALLQAEGVEARSHDGVRTMVSLHFIRTGRLPREAGRFLARRHDERWRADYEAESFLTDEDAEIAITEAEQFLLLAEVELQAMGLL